MKEPTCSFSTAALVSLITPQASLRSCPPSELSAFNNGVSPSVTDGPFTVDRHVADAITVLDAVDAERVVVVGHSWGGHLALQLALQHPDRVIATVAIESLGISGDGGTGALHDELRARLTDSAKHDLATLERQINLDGDPDEVLSLEALRLLWPSYFADPSRAPNPPADLRVCSRCNAESTASAMQHLANDSLKSALRQLQPPVIAIAGADSPMPNPISREISDATEGTLITIPDAGHLPWIEQPGCVGAAVQLARSL